jgi:hypothetical protein
VTQKVIANAGNGGDAGSMRDSAEQVKNAPLAEKLSPR